MILYFQFKLKAEVRKEEAFLDLQTRIEKVGKDVSIENSSSKKRTAISVSVQSKK